MILTTKTARKALAYWQKQLRLQDWNITVKVARRSDMATNAYGEVSPSRIYRQADIALRDPTDFADDDGPRERDMEDSLVHELLHVVLKDCRIDARDDDGNLTSEGIAEERAIDALAAAIVGLHRKKGK